ncbi:phosphotransferase [Singulisphaera sp. GP187]|uniref:phosphotransferase n=1 Tax=Singulisphaera sp. GP187 TaxID=1882752 RepID=UPI00094112D4|nr:phosphotransferase [Singulisphaera sp. GP187]
MNTDRIHTQRIQTLSYWTRPVTIEPLPGGITNHNYLVSDAGQLYVARLCVDKTLLGIDRRNEVVCHKAAHACGIAPELVHQEDGVLVTQHVAGRTLAPEDVRDLAFIPRLVAALQTLHESWDELTGEILYFSPFQTARTYAKTAGSLNARLPSDIDHLLEDAGHLSRQLGLFVPVLCHNDLLAGNLIDDDERIWLVDWEYAGIGHPLFDLAGVCANNAFSESQELALLEAYRGSIHASDLRDLRILKTMSSLREALWAVIQTVASDIDFDYVRYANENFEAYREARRQLKSPAIAP